MWSAKNVNLQLFALHFPSGGEEHVKRRPCLRVSPTSQRFQSRYKVQKVDQQVHLMKTPAANPSVFITLQKDKPKKTCGIHYFLSVDVSARYYQYLLIIIFCALWLSPAKQLNFLIFCICFPPSQLHHISTVEFTAGTVALHVNLLRIYRTFKVLGCSWFANDETRKMMMMMTCCCSTPI